MSKKDNINLQKIEGFNYKNFELIEMYSDYGDVTGIQTLRRFIQHCNKHFGKLNESIKEFIRLYTDLSEMIAEHEAFIEAWNEMIVQNENFIKEVREVLEAWIDDPRVQKWITDRLDKMIQEELPLKLDVKVFEDFKDKNVIEIAKKLDKIVFDSYKKEVDIKVANLEKVKADKTELDKVKDKLDEVVTTVNNKMSLQDIQDAINKGGLVEFEKGDYNVGFLDKQGEFDIVFNVPDNTTIDGKGSTFTLGKHNTRHYAIFNIIDKRNITIKNAKIDGQRRNNAHTAGEWGMGVMIKGSTNISLENLDIVNCWGDGIYIGDGKLNRCVNISLKNIVCDNNRRQGISVISVDGLVGDNVTLSNTNGTSPEAGIDFEPNNDGEVLKNIVFRNLRAINNKGNGIFAHLLPLKTKPEVSMTFINTEIDGANRGVAMQQLNEGGRGYINFDGLTVRNARQNAIWFNAFSTDTAKINLRNIKTEDCQTDGSQHVEQGNIVQFVNTKYDEKVIGMDDIIVDGHSDVGSSVNYRNVGFIQYVGRPYKNIKIRTSSDAIFGGRDLEYSDIECAVYKYFPGTSPVETKFATTSLFSNEIRGWGGKNLLFKIPKIANESGAEFTYYHMQDRTDVWTRFEFADGSDVVPAEYKKGIWIGNEAGVKGSYVTIKCVGGVWVIGDKSGKWKAVT